MDRSISGGCLLLVGLFLMTLLLVTPSKEGFLFNFVMSVFVSSPFMLIGGWLLRRHFKAKGEAAKAAQAAREKEILLLAERNGGSLTVSHVVTHTSLDAEQAEMVLQQLVAHGCASIRSSETGMQVLYEFSEFLHSNPLEQQKASEQNGTPRSRLIE